MLRTIAPPPKWHEMSHGRLLWWPSDTPPADERQVSGTRSEVMHKLDQIARVHNAIAVEVGRTILAIARTEVVNEHEEVVYIDDSIAGEIPGAVVRRHDSIKEEHPHRSGVVATIVIVADTDHQIAPAVAIKVTE